MRLALCWILTAFVGLLMAEASRMELKSRIKTEQVYRTPNIPSNWIYAIDVKRVESNSAGEDSRCWPVPRTIKVVRS